MDRKFSFCRDCHSAVVSLSHLLIEDKLLNTVFLEIADTVIRFTHIVERPVHCHNCAAVFCKLAGWGNVSKVAGKCKMSFGLFGINLNY